ncbi:hypothetical protein HDU91_003063 [Kappamyces sp. JEL0680]|nr:hypothetical protein HDU91_003063 [Kappamyces sp. JEL0680]
MEETTDAYMEPGTGARFEELFHILMRIKKFPILSENHRLMPQVVVLRAGLTEIVSTFHLLHELNRRASTRYDITVPANEKKLLEWQKIGFQGKDPSTDFRSMGLLALDNLHFFCDRYNQIAKRILTVSHHQTSWFSLAIVGINITAYCLRLVRTRQLQWTFYAYGVSKEIFNEVYCFVFDAWETYWSGQKKPPSVMDFNRLFKAFQIEFEIHLLQRQPVFLKEKPRAISRSFKQIKKE